MSKHRAMNRVENKSVRDQVYARLMEMILDGSYPAGMRLDLNQLTESLGVSKTPVNEALQGLLREGLVTVKPRSGTFVSKIDIDKAVENFGFRLAIETGAAEMILERITDSELYELERLNDVMRMKISGKPTLRNLRLALRADFDLHKVLVSASKNGVIAEKYCRANALLVVARMQDLYELKDYRKSIEEHAVIIQKIRDQDLDGFRAASKTHIECGITRLRTYGIKSTEGAQTNV